MNEPGPVRRDVNSYADNVWVFRGRARHNFNVPPKDRFQIVSQHGSGGLVYDSSYLDIARTDGIVVIQITLNAGRSIEMKKALYARIAELLASSPGVRREDVFVSLVEVPKENWS